MVQIDSSTMRKGPGENYGVVIKAERGHMVGILGQNRGGDWLYVIDAAANYGWLPTASLRITGSLDGAPVLPADPVAAFLAKLAAGGTTSTTQTTPTAGGGPVSTVADLKPVATGQLNQAANMRQRPGADFPVLGALAQGDQVSVLALNKDKQWALVETAQQKRGWVSLGFLTVAGDLSTAPQVLSVTPPADYPADQLAPVVTASGQPVAGTIPQSASPAAAPVSSGPVIEAAASGKPALPGRVLAEVAAGLVKRKVDLQRGPDVSSGAVAELTVDEPVSVLAVNAQKDWVVAQGPQGRVGWAPVDSLTLTGSLDKAPVVLTAWVKENEVAVRNGPAIFNDKVGVLAINNLVAVLARNQNNDWVLVETLTGGRGWISPRFLSFATHRVADVPLITSFVPAAAEAPAAAASVSAPSAPLRPALNVLVFQRSSGGDIMLINADGSGLRRLTNGIDPVLSPDGKSVAFTRWQGEQGALWTMNVDGSNEHQVIDGVKQAKGPEWSPDGAKIVLNYQHGGRLEAKEDCFKLGSGRTPSPPWNSTDFKTKIEMAGRTPVVYLCWMLPPDPHWGLRLVNLADGRFEDVDGGTYAFRPTWDPAQTWRIVSDGGRGLLGVDLNRPGEYRQTLTDNVNDNSPVFSPDGRYLAATSGNPGGGFDIYRLNADGSGRVRLTKTPLWVGVSSDEQKPWNNVTPAWSPDGAQIAFLTDRTGRWEIWVMGADGANPHPLFAKEINDQLNIQYNFVDERVFSWR